MLHGVLTPEEKLQVAAFRLVWKVLKRNALGRRRHVRRRQEGNRNGKPAHQGYLQNFITAVWATSNDRYEQAKPSRVRQCLDFRRRAS